MSAMAASAPLRIRSPAEWRDALHSEGARARRTTSASNATLSVGADPIDPIHRARAGLHRAPRVGERHAIDSATGHACEHDERRRVVSGRIAVLDVTVVVEHAPAVNSPRVAVPPVGSATRVPDGRHRPRQPGGTGSRWATAATTGCNP